MRREVKDDSITFYFAPSQWWTLTFDDKGKVSTAEITGREITRNEVTSPGRSPEAESQSPVPATTETAAATHEAPSFSLTKIWANKDLAHQPEAEGLCLRDGFLYVGAGASHRKISKVRVADGVVQWSQATGSTYQPSYPVANGDVVVFGTYYSPSQLVGLDDKTGAERWTVPTGEQNMSAAIFADDLAFIGSYDQHLYAVDWAKGVIRWKTRLGAPVWCRPAVVGDRVFVACYDGLLYALNRASGEVVARVDCGGRLQSDLLVVGGLLFLLVDDQKYGEPYNSSKQQQKTLLAIDLAQDKIVSRIPAETSISKKLIVSGSEVYFFDYATLYCYDTKARRVAWKFQPGYGMAPYPLVYEKVIVLPLNYCGREGQHTRRVVTLARDTGKVLSRAEDGGIGVLSMPNIYYLQYRDLLIITSSGGTEAYQLPPAPVVGSAGAKEAQTRDGVSGRPAGDS
jgi:outer membrane protein assembly factor BamB